MGSVRKFELDDARCLYKNHLEEDVIKWIPNESYADMEETKEAINFLGIKTHLGGLHGI